MERRHAISRARPVGRRDFAQDGNAMNFLCICMSPALDATVTLERAPAGRGEVFKDVAETVNVGGKAVNVARWLAVRGANVACGGLLGDGNDAPFARELAKYGIEDRFVRIDGETRRNEMIVWPGGSMKLNRAAFAGLDAGALDALAPRIFASGEERGVAILSGSLPKAAPADFYTRAVAALKAGGWTVVLDASGEPMRRALDAKPDVIKPNAEECEALAGFVPSSQEEFARATAILREKVEHVVISDGGAGAWFDGAFAPAPKVEVLDTTAAGDTLLAEYCYRTFCAPCADAAAWAVAAGSAACTMPGGAPPPAALVERLRRQ